MHGPLRRNHVHVRVRGVPPDDVDDKSWQECRILEFVFRRQVGATVGQLATIELVAARDEDGLNPCPMADSRGAQ